MEVVLLPNAVIVRLYLEGSRFDSWPVGQLPSEVFVLFCQSFVTDYGIVFLIGP